MPSLEIVTSRLCLLPFTQEICQQVLAGEYTALEHTGITPAPGWPDEETLDTLPKILKNLAKVPAPTGFESWMVLKKENMTLIGDASFKGVPNPNGEVDLGYGIIAAEQQKGYGLEVAQALTN
ncbi:GNAT family N-acetyltransferase [Nibribacter koreensis]|uniref:N-acetyltransferase domain-containing protein n=1 Tax=Nibribacter koreensis TaxID=1084519 RepID=A0ABP8FNC4_9BACT